jgi:hypothetical protein
MCRQPDIGGEHKPKRIITHEWNIDKHCDECEEGNNERNHVHAENVENPDSSNSHMASLLKASQEQELLVSRELQMKQVINDIFLR